MISQRTSGLRAVLALCQMGLTACLFWAEFFALLVSLGDKTRWSSYVVYCSVLLLGLLVETLSYRRVDASTFQRGDFINAHRLSLRQTFSASACCSFTSSPRKTSRRRASSWRYSSRRIT